MYMSTNHEFHLMQLSDSFFPSGMFSMSSGLESLANAHKITNWNDVLNFILEQIEFQIFPCDCTVLSLAFSGVKNNDLKTVVDIDKKYYSMKFAKEVRNSSTRSGKQLLNSLIHMIDNQGDRIFLYEFNEKIKSKETPGTYPITLAICAICLDIPIESVTRMLLYSFSSSVVSAAIRLGLIQHLDAQKILKLLAQPINTFILTNKTKNIQDIWQLTPLVEIHQMNHERNESRMFIT
ncbi:MAG TPA: urease accessory UreF family protein [Nitrosopumilaceae archaeon]|nr:urease accessory UreF family protein [Nitrosopumilaceae archaeon]